jgi:uncharacterized membrane protein
LTKDKRQNKAWLFLVIVIFLLGLFFRCANLDRKIFWVDEVATAIRTAGYTSQEVTNQLADRGIIGIEDLQHYQKLNPDKDFGDSLSAFRQSPEHAPLYFLIARFWRQLFGSSVTALRSLSIALGLLAFPCLYWLCLELFKSPRVGWVAIALFSVSPFYIAYAQEARPYSLWTVTILLSGVALLRAIRFNNFPGWGFYSLTLILGFYTSLLSFLVTFGQGIFVITLEKFRYTKAVRNYFIATGIALIAFIPWITVILAHWQALQDNTTWIRVPVDLSFLLAIFVATILLVFGDLPLSNSLEHLAIVEILVILVLMSGLFFLLFHSKKIKQNKIIFSSSIAVIILIFINVIPINLNRFSVNLWLEIIPVLGIIIALGLLALTFFSILFVCTRSPKQIKLFILTQTLATPAILIINDLIANDQSAGAPRYLMPFQLGIQLAVAYLLACQIEPIDPTKLPQKKVWILITIGLISVGIISGFLNLEKSPIYQKSRNFHNRAITTIINNAKKPLLLVDSAQTIDILSLSRDLEEKVKVSIISEPDKFSQLMNGCQEIFIFNPSETLRKKLKERDRLSIEQVYKPKLLIPGETVLSLWSVKKTSPCINDLTRSQIK